MGAKVWVYRRGTLAALLTRSPQPAPDLAAHVPRNMEPGQDMVVAVQEEASCQRVYMRWRLGDSHGRR